MKKFIQLVLAVALVLGAVPGSVRAEDQRQCVMLSEKMQKFVESLLAQPRAERYTIMDAAMAAMEVLKDENGSTEMEPLTMEPAVAAVTAGPTLTTATRSNVARSKGGTSISNDVTIGEF